MAAILRRSIGSVVHRAPSASRSFCNIAPEEDINLDATLLPAKCGPMEECRFAWGMDQQFCFLFLQFPGVGKEAVKKVSINPFLVIEGNTVSNYWYDYNVALGIPKELCKLDQAKAEFKDGWLKLKIPKRKPEEIMDHVDQLQIDG